MQLKDYHVIKIYPYLNFNISRFLISGSSLKKLLGKWVNLNKRLKIVCRIVREAETSSPLHWFTPYMATVVGAGPGVSGRHQPTGTIACCLRGEVGNWHWSGARIWFSGIEMEWNAHHFLSCLYSSCSAFTAVNYMCCKNILRMALKKCRRTHFVSNGNEN